MNTRGEASEFGKLASQYKWKTVAVVTSKHHTQRAGLLMSQCVNADVTIVSTTSQFSKWQWLRRFVIETGRLFDVHLRLQCDSPVGT